VQAGRADDAHRIAELGHDGDVVGSDGEEAQRGQRQTEEAQAEDREEDSASSGRDPLLSTVFAQAARRES